MRKGFAFLLAFVLAAGLLAAPGQAQILAENHYLVYDVVETDIFFDGNITLFDQFIEGPFGPYSTNQVHLEKFANPADKNGEGIPSPLTHQTWWRIDHFAPERTVQLQNQFEAGPTGIWYVKDAHWLILPAEKDAQTSVPKQIEDWNHYKCYEEVSDNPQPVELNGSSITLADQWGGVYTFDTIYREYFCNPCDKEVDGVLYPRFDATMHLAVYRIEPPITFTSREATVTDQFITRDLTLTNPMWFCVPSQKLSAISLEKNSWGGLKALYR